MGNKYSEFSKAEEVFTSVMNDKKWIKGCMSKRKYPTYRHAKVGARASLERRGIRCRIYRCHSCNYFHLTSRL